jgi:hypothetical protein
LTPNSKSFRIERKGPRWSTFLGLTAIKNLIGLSFEVKHYFIDKKVAFDSEYKIIEESSKNLPKVKKFSKI